MHIPPDLVVKSQAIDMAEIILSRIRRPNAVHTLCRNRISRFEQLSTSEAHWSTTKSDGMWTFQPMFWRNIQPLVTEEQDSQKKGPQRESVEGFITVHDQFS
jgi:hypothetical protein